MGMDKGNEKTPARNLDDKMFLQALDDFESMLGGDLIPRRPEYVGYIDKMRAELTPRVGKNYITVFHIPYLILNCSLTMVIYWYGYTFNGNLGRMSFLYG